LLRGERKARKSDRWRHAQNLRRWKEPLHRAAAAGRVATVAALLASGTEVDARGQWNATALHAASGAGELASVTLLLEKGAKLDATDEPGMTPLHCAALGGHLPVVEALLAKGASHAARDGRGRTPLHLATLEDHRDVALALIAAGADVNALAADGSAPIHHAARNGALEVVAAILEAGGEVGITGESQWPALFHAARARQVEVARLLVTHGADVDAAVKGLRAIHVAVHADAGDIIDVLADAGADLNATVGAQVTPLQLAAKACSLDALKALLRHGARTDLKNQRGQTALMIARTPGESKKRQRIREESARLLEAHAPADEPASP
jgi:cytohesin